MQKNISGDVLPIDTMENWDEEQLRDVVNKKHAEQEKSLPKTAIVSGDQYCV